MNHSLEKNNEIAETKSNSSGVLQSVGKIAMSPLVGACESTVEMFRLPSKMIRDLNQPANLENATALARNYVKSVFKILTNPHARLLNAILGEFKK